MGKFSEREVLIWLNTIYVNNSSILKLLDYFPDIREILEVDSKLLFKLPGIKREYIEKIINNRKPYSIEKIFERLGEWKISTITCLDEEYPDSLKYIYDSPAVLYYRGEFLEEDVLSIAIVGARKSTAYGKWVCEKFAKELVNLGVTIVSGLALGIDAIAHRTALENGGRTIAVLGNGLDVRYPRRNLGLYDDIVKQGVVLTEFPLGSQPLSYNFPQRNRIISGLSQAVIVIEAKEKSGSLITAHHAVEQGKDVFAVPGNINSIYSSGTNKLIKDGAFPLLEIDDLLDEVVTLKDRLLKIKRDKIDYSELSETEKKIVDTLKDGPVHSDLIAHRTGLDIATVHSVLTILELKGIIKELTGRTYSIS